MSFAKVLQEAAEASGCPLPAAMAEACQAHFQVLVTWNRTHNLTRIVKPAEAARLHYLDALLPLLSWPAPASFVDVGSGAGFPGLLAALAWPKARGALVEPARKRASFLEVAGAAMGLGSERVVVAAPGGGPLAERVLSRATFSPGERGPLRSYAQPGGEIGLWGHPHDAATWREELSTWGWEALEPIPYQVHGLEERCVLRGREAGAR